MVRPSVFEARQNWATEAGKMAADARAKHLIINHHIPFDPEIPDQAWLDEINTHYDGPITIARNGTAINLS